MFGGASINPYDEIVVKTTDEHLTSENWELILNLCDKVQDEGPEGAHNVVAALLKRLTHRNPNVQLYALSLAEALSKNCSIELHRELASRAWTAGLERVITDRNTHEKVRTRALGLVALWTSEFADDSTLGIMQECYDSLKAKNYKYTQPDTPPPPAVDDAVRRAEEEELQRVLEMSVRDRGGRGGAGGYDAYSGSGASGAGAGSASTPAYGAGGSSSGGGAPAYGASTGASASGSSGAGGGYAGGYVPATTQRERTPSPAPADNAPAPASSAIVTRVRALHPFVPTEAGELGFEKGDVIKVVDRGYRDWWRGQLRGRTGIFPVNYVEPLPEPTPAELAAEAAAEAAVFAQAVDVERLLNMLRALDPSKGDNLADDEEIQELYRASMALRPKIVKLIDKYSQKRADLVSMNETFVRARTIFDRMMEESLARHSGAAYYPQQGPTPYPGQQQQYGAPGQQQQPYGGYPDAAAYQYAQQQQQGQQQGQPGYGAYGPQGPTPYPAQQQQGPTPYPAQQQPQAQGPTPYPAQQQPQQAQGPTPYPAQQQQQPQPQSQTPTPYPTQQQQPQQQAQPQPQAQQQPAQQVQQPQPAQAQPQSQAQPEPQPQAQAQAQQAGPPYIYDPHTTYADPNVQAWAQYYAAGGKDLAGSVYFVSIPGITDAAPTPAPAPAAQQPAQQQQQQPAQQQQPQPIQQQQQRESVSPTSPLDDDPGYFPDPYANQPVQEYAAQEYPQQQQQEYHPPASQGELAHALGPQPAQTQYQGYALQDPGAGSALGIQQQQPRHGYSLTDPGAAPSSPIAAASGGGSPGVHAESTPSWVLPKKTAGPGARGPGSPSAQFAGMHV
ncbi:hypothetical protein C8R44DRAFT_676373 [Mycena epipterygia]|nr:hypothetical protein C8R44DRAFT_676373 [Mycena epipterygia]